MSRTSNITGETKPYTVRKMRVDLIRRMKLVTKHIDATMEELINDTVDRGLVKLEIAVGLRKVPKIRREVQ